MIQIKKLYHRGEFRIGMYFGYESALKEKAKSIDARWSLKIKVGKLPVTAKYYFIAPIHP